MDEAIQVVRTAEQKLRELILQAAKEADYDHLQLLAEWAKHLQTLLGAHTVSEDSPAAAKDRDSALPAPPRSGSHARRAPAKSRPPTSNTRRTAVGGRGRKPRKSDGKKPEYPKFFREGEMLVKVGWSRRERKTYEHKAPRRVLQALVQALVQAGKDGERFTMEGVFPLKDPADSSEIPAYQSYLTLAWLRGNGLVVQHGRQGYSLPEDTDLTRAGDRLWNNLPSR